MIGLSLSLSFNAYSFLKTILTQLHINYFYIIYVLK